MARIALTTWQRRAWRWALGCFLLAGATGVVFRFGLLWGLPAGLAFEKVRHAHSHLMYFGWVTPALFTWMYALVPHITGRPLRRPGAAAWSVGLTLAAAGLSYPLFLVYGYEPARIGPARLPLSAMAASLNVLAWYRFVWLFRRQLKEVAGSDPAAMVRRLWSAALAFLVWSSVGAWSRGLLNAVPVADPFWKDAAVHLFLDVFSDGWMVLALLGAGYAVHTRPGAAPSRWAVWGWGLAVAGIPLSFLLGIPVHRVPAALRFVAGVAGFAGAAGLLMLVGDLARIRRPDPLWWFALAALALKAGALGLVAFPSAAVWAERANLRILYLHLTLLGGVTTGLVSVARRLGGVTSGRAPVALAAAAGSMLISLLGLTPLWPDALGGRWVLHWSAWAAAATWAAGLWVFATGVPSNRTPVPVPRTGVAP